MMPSVSNVLDETLIGLQGFVTKIMGAAAELERRLIADRTRAGLLARRTCGERLGRPSALSKNVLTLIAGMRSEGLTLRTIAMYLADAGIPTALGCGTWHAQSVAQALRTHELDLEAAALRSNA